MTKNDAYQKWVDGNLNFRLGPMQREAFHAGWEAASAYVRRVCAEEAECAEDDLNKYGIADEIRKGGPT
jgi:hypothetical protein